MRNSTFTAAILTLALVLVSRPSVQAQTAKSRSDIVQIEYFVDTDPGRGLGKQVEISAGPEQDLNFTVDLGGIDAGFHVLYVRVKDETGLWSLTQAQPFIQEKTRLDETPRITALEYFVDEDSGPGNGTEVTLEEDIDLDQRFTVDLGDSDAGFHVLYVRIQDEFGNWSLTQAQPFVLEKTRLDETPRITALEYFIDEDSGPGNGTEVILEEDTDLDQRFSVDLGDSDAGFHVLYVRIRDEFGNWSLTQAQPFVQESARLDTSARIASIQYYFTGAETKTALRTFADFTPASVIDLDFLADLSGLDTEGDHRIHLFAVDDKGRYGQEHVRPFQTVLTTGAPVLVDRIVDQNLASGGAPFIRDLITDPVVFSDPEGDVLSYTIASSDSTIIEATVTGSSLKLSPLAAGDATITVTATDGTGNSTALNFTVTVEEAAASTTNTGFTTAIASTSTRAIVGETVNLTISALNTIQVKGCLITARYDPAIFAFQGFTSGDLIPGLITLSAEPETGADGLAIAQGGGTQLTGIPGSGDGALGTLTFEIVSDLPADGAFISIVDVEINASATDRDALTFAEGALGLEVLPGVALPGDIDVSGVVDFTDFFLFADNFGKEALGKLIALAQEQIGLPAAPQLEQNYPNPFNSATTLRYQLVGWGRVRLEIFALTGQKVRTLVDAQGQPGMYQVSWDGTDDQGRAVSTGIYLGRLQMGRFAEVKKIMAVK